MRCLFASDLHGRVDRYRKLLARVAEERPAVVLLGGDLLPGPGDSGWLAEAGEGGFITGFLAAELGALAERLGPDYPRILVILGNDDPRSEESGVLDLAASGLWTYAHGRRVEVQGLPFYGYSYVPPTPFMLKDWERYDVSRYVDPGCVHPDEGRLTLAVDLSELRHGTIAADLAELTVGAADLADSVWLFHSPPYQTRLDRAALDGRQVEHVPLDVHVGSIAIRRFIENAQPRLTLHGHIHESARLTGAWADRLGRTYLYSAAHDGPELALVRIDTEDLGSGSRELL